jgi:hypothetical protein
LEDILPKFDSQFAGVKTPASVFGITLISRLRNIGIQFTIDKSSFERDQKDMDLVNMSRYVYMK